MRTYLVHGLAATVAVVLVACSNTYPQQPKDPINADPKPQQAVNDPKPQQPIEGPGYNDAQKPISDPNPQASNFNTPTSQEPFSDPMPQKPFYGPGLVAPEDRAEERAKAKQPLASDAEALSVVLAINDGEVQMAEMAKKAATNPEVKNFAGMMATHHTQGMQKVRSLQSKTKIELKDNDVTAKVKNDAGQNMAMLRDKKGKEFDRLYMDAQVRLHQEALDVLDNRVLPAITNGEVKTGVSEMRRQVADHLAKAEQIQKKLDPTLADARKDEGDKKTSTTTTTSGTTAKAKANDAKNDTKKAAKDAKEDTKKAAKDTKDEAKEKKNDVKDDVKH